jgi:hypothetical protein
MGCTLRPGLQREYADYVADAMRAGREMRDSGGFEWLADTAARADIVKLLNSD